MMDNSTASISSEPVVSTKRKTLQTTTWQVSSLLRSYENSWSACWNKVATAMPPMPPRIPSESSSSMDSWQEIPSRNIPSLVGTTMSESWSTPVSTHVELYAEIETELWKGTARIWIPNRPTPSTYTQMHVINCSVVVTSCWHQDDNAFSYFFQRALCHIGAKQKERRLQSYCEDRITKYH